MNPIIKHLEEGTLIYDARGHVDNGEQFLSLFVALAGEGKCPDDCPASLMPQWFAHLTEWIDNAGTEEHWPVAVRRYAELSEKWSILSAEDWSLLQLRVKKTILEAVRTFSGPSQSAVDASLKLICHEISGGVVSAEEREASIEAARASALVSRAGEAAGRVASTSITPSSTIAWPYTNGEIWTAVSAAWATEALRDHGVSSDALVDRILDRLEEAIFAKEAA